jgi:hypothetical protein
MERRPALRASDSDREKIAEQLRRATAEGRLFAEELEERLGALFSSRTYGELDRLVADLPPDTKPSRTRPRVVVPARAVAPIAIVIAVGLTAAAAAAQQSAFQVRWTAARGTNGGFGHETAHYFVSWPAIAALLVILPLCAGVAWVFLQKAPGQRGPVTR